jgi:hypothetical protein
MVGNIGYGSNETYKEQEKEMKGKGYEVQKERGQRGEKSMFNKKRKSHALMGGPVSCSHTG